MMMFGFPILMAQTGQLLLTQAGQLTTMQITTLLVYHRGRNAYLANTYHPIEESRIGIAQTWKSSYGSWVFPKNLITPGVLTHNLYAEYFMNSDRTVLLLALERADSYGMKDIYVSFSTNQIEWSDPINVGKDINTASNEMAPFLLQTAKPFSFIQRITGIR